MSADYREIEIKFYVPDLDSVRHRLEAAGAALHSPRVYERNVRYDRRDGALVTAGAILRLRQDTRARLTYKEGGSELDAGLFARFEAEVEVSDFAAMETILEKLGFAPVLIYEKFRTTYQLENAEVVLDEMPYGMFVEIEGEAEPIQRAVAALELGGAQRFRGGYAALFENVRRHLGLTFRDLTFENFSGILVPETAFHPVESE